MYSIVDLYAYNYESPVWQFVYVHLIISFKNYITISKMGNIRVCIYMGI